MKKTFPLHAVLTMRTGKMMSDSFSQAHELAEWVLGHPVWTHELASYLPSIQEKLAKQFPNLPDKLPSVNNYNCRAVLGDLEKIHGSTLEVEQGNEERTQSPIDTLVDMVGEDKVIAVQV